MRIAVALFDRFTALDAVGPYEVLRFMPDTEVVFVADRPGPVTADSGALTLVAEASLAECTSADLVLVPGGPGAEHAEHLHDWLREVDRTTTWTTSVCTGSLILAAAGLLTGRRAVTHWSAMTKLGTLGAVAVEQRVVFDGKYVTAAGVSAGIDMGLTLAGRICGEQTAQVIQLFVEYEPEPPFHAGSPRTAPQEIMEIARRHGRDQRT